MLRNRISGQTATLSITEDTLRCKVSLDPLTSKFNQQNWPQGSTSVRKVVKAYQGLRVATHAVDTETLSVRLATLSMARLALVGQAPVHHTLEQGHLTQAIQFMSPQTTQTLQDREHSQSSLKAV